MKRFAITFSEPPAQRYAIQCSVLAEGETTAETIMTETEWSEYLAAHTAEHAAYATWKEAQDAAAPSQVSAEDLINELGTAYSNFSDGGKWAFGNAYDTVLNHVRRGDIAAAKLTVQMIAIPAEVPGTSPEELATWTVKKTEILALFP
jgi:hypothetical protein